MKKIIFVLTSVFLLASCKKDDKNQTDAPDQSPSTPKPISFVVTYNKNGGNIGTVPIDGNSYKNGDTAIILGNTGILSKTGFSFMGWNSDTLGTGANYCPGGSVIISGANLNLYARWIANSINPASENATLTCGGSGWQSSPCASSSSLTLKGKSGMVEVILTFNTIPTMGTYNISNVSGPLNVHVAVLNVNNQTCGVTWFGKTGVVTVNNTSKSIIASFTGIPCTQSNFNFPVVSLSGSVSCY